MLERRDNLNIAQTSSSPPLCNDLLSVILDVLTEINRYAIMKKLGKREHPVSNSFDPNEGERTLLPSSKSGMRSPSLDFTNTSAETFTDDMALEYLAKIISSIYIKRLYGNYTQEKSSNILPGINKRTS